MKNWKLNNWLTLFGAISLFLFTFFRENFLLIINALLSNDKYSRAYFYWFSDFFEHLSKAELLKWKWGITISFSLIMSLITIASLYSWFQSKQQILLIIKIYVITFFTVVLIAFFAWLVNNFDAVYPILRKILGVIQTPIPLVTFFLLYYQLNKKDN